jgi:hypothetical protein
MVRSRRYDEYPDMARLVRAMSDGQRDSVAHWHRTLITGLEGAVPRLKRETADTLVGQGLTLAESAAAAGGAEGALTAWLRVMRSVAELLADARPGDWCCKPGMMASPAPCPQHGFFADREYELGTTIERYDQRTAVPGGRMKKERAVYVVNSTVHDERLWRSVESARAYSDEEIVRAGGWTVVGRV